MRKLPHEGIIFPLMKKTLLIIPTYNERENITRLVALIRKIVPEATVCVVDGNSPDGTADAVKAMQRNDAGIILIEQAKKNGLGGAYRAGFARALAEKDIDTVITMDADFSHHPRYLPDLIAARASCDMAIGSRYVRGGGTHGWGLGRRLLSRFGNQYARFVTGMPFHDCTSGFNAISADLLRKTDWQLCGASGFAFLMELKWALMRRKPSWKEVPIVFEDRKAGESKISARIVYEGILLPLRMRFGKKRVYSDVSA